MTLDQLETFRRVAHLGSFTRAAAQLNTTQSTVSMRIGELERTLGAQVFDRSRRTVRMTPKGRDLLRYAEAIHALVTELRIVVGHPGAVSGSINMGVAELVALTWLPALVSTLNRLYPKIEIDLRVGLTGDMRGMIRDREIDLGLLPASEPPGPGLDADVLGWIDFAFLASPELALPAAPLGPRDLARWPLISLGPNSVIAEIQETWFRDGRASPKRLSRSNSMEISAGLVRSGLGVALLPVAYYRADIERRRMVMIDVVPPLPPVAFFAIRAAGDPSPLVARVVEIARRVGRFDRACSDAGRPGRPGPVGDHPA